MKAKLTGSLISIFVLILFVSCAPGSEKFSDEPAGFWMGLWHGCISVVTLIIGIFDSCIRIYETNNTGWWYDFGFILGAGFAFSNIWFTGNRAAKKKD